MSVNKMLFGAQKRPMASSIADGILSLRHPHCMFAHEMLVLLLREYRSRERGPMLRAVYFVTVVFVVRRVLEVDVEAISGCREREDDVIIKRIDRFWILKSIVSSGTIR